MNTEELVAHLPAIHQEANCVWQEIGGDDETRIVAPVSQVVGSLRATRRPKDADKYDWAKPTYKDSPISVELIRTADEDDAWNLCIDGQICHELIDDSVKDGQRAKCPIPPPLPREELLDTSSKVRRIVFTCRLEEESKAPSNVELIVHQIVQSNERRDQGDNAREEPALEVGRYNIKPYATSEPSANALVMPYPFSAPAQSSMAIVSYNEVRNHYEQQKAYDKIQSEFKEISKQYSAQRAQDASLPGTFGSPESVGARKRREDEFNKKRLAALQPPPVPNRKKERIHVIGGMHKSAPQQLALLLNKITAAIQEMTKWERKTLDQTGFSTPQDAAAQYKEAYRTAFPNDKNEPDGYAYTNAGRREAVRWWLRQANAYAALDLFDALATCPDYLPQNDGWIGNLLTSLGYYVDPAASIGSTVQPDLDDATDANTSSSASQALDNEVAIDIEGYETSSSEHPQVADVGAPQSYDAPKLSSNVGKSEAKYDFVFDRMMFDKRRNTTLRIEYTLLITEADGTERKVILQQDELFGQVAHAVYSEVEKHEQELRMAVSTLSKTLKQNDIGGSLPTIYDSAIDAVYFPFTGWKTFKVWIDDVEKEAAQLTKLTWPQFFTQGLKKYLLGKSRSIYAKVNQKKLQNSLYTLLLMCGFDTGPVWPEGEMSRDLSTQLSRMQYSRKDLIEATHIRRMPQIVVTPEATRIPIVVKPDDTQEPDEWATVKPKNYWSGYSAKLILGSLFAIGVGKAMELWTIWFTGWTLPAVITGMTGAISPVGALAAVAAYFASDTFKEATDEVVGLLAGLTGQWAWVKTTLTVASVVRSTIIQRTHEEMAYDTIRQEAYDRALQLTRGSTVASAFAHARVAMVRLKESVNTKEFKTLAKMGTRFQLTQEYHKVPESLPIQGKPVLTAEEWDTIPTSSLLTMLPPSDVLERLYETAVLRRINIEEAVRITVGRIPNKVPTTPAEVQAATVHADLMYELQYDRLPIRAEHLFASVPQHAARLAYDACKLIAAAYSTRARSTYVGGEDELWSCMSNGALARVMTNQIAVVEHFNRERMLQQQALRSARFRLQNEDFPEAVALKKAILDAENATTVLKASRYAFDKETDESITERRAQDLFKNWGDRYKEQRDAFIERRKKQQAFDNADLAVKTRQAEDELLGLFDKLFVHATRVQIDDFVDAWRKEADRNLQMAASVQVQRGSDASGEGVQQFLTFRDKGIGIGAVNFSTVVTQVARTSERMKALGITAGPLFAVTAAPMLRRIADKSSFARIEAQASEFDDQDGWQSNLSNDTKDNSKTLNIEKIEYAWASRRIDLDDFMSMSMLRAGSGDLVHRMAALAVEKPTEKVPTHYYCPTGNVLNALPGRIPFNIDSETSRVVWLELLIDALRLLIQGIVIGQSSVTVNTVRIESKPATGIGRHPLVVTERRIGSVSAFFCPVHWLSKFEIQADVPDSINKALEYTANSENADGSRWMRSASMFAREVAFNADRFKHCIGLAMRRQPQSQSVIVPLQVMAYEPTKDTQSDTPRILERVVDAIEGVAPINAAFSLAIAMALYAAEIGVAVPAVTVEVMTEQESTSIKTRLSALHKKCVTAFKERKCKAVRMGEVCILAAEFTEFATVV